METFKAVNNGRLKDVPLPRSIDLLISGVRERFRRAENFGNRYKGIDDVAVREDLDDDRKILDPPSCSVHASTMRRVTAHVSSLTICGRPSRSESILEKC